MSEWFVCEAWDLFVFGFLGFALGWTWRGLLAAIQEAPR